MNDKIAEYSNLHALCKKDLNRYGRMKNSEVNLKNHLRKKYKALQ